MRSKEYVKAYIIPTNHGPCMKIINDICEEQNLHVINDIFKGDLGSNNN